MSGQRIRIKAQGQNSRQVAIKRQIELAALAPRRHRHRHDLLNQAPIASRAALSRSVSGRSRSVRRGDHDTYRPSSD